MSQERAEELITAIGPLLELTEVARLDEPAGSWTVVVEDDALVLLTHDPEWDRLTLGAEVATPPPDRAATIYRTVLLYNNEWAATGGLRMALSQPDGSIVQIVDLPLAQLDASGLGNVLMGFVEKLRGWREAIDGGPASDAAQPGDSHFVGMIKV